MTAVERAQDADLASLPAIGHELLMLASRGGHELVLRVRVRGIGRRRTGGGGGGGGGQQAHATLAPLAPQELVPLVEQHTAKEAESPAVLAAVGELLQRVDLAVKHDAELGQVCWWSAQGKG